MLKQFNVIKVTFILGLFFFALSCKKKPKVCITVNQTKTEDRIDTGVVNLPRDFVVSCDRDASTYQWDFGDDTQLEHGKIISHTYTTVGSYTVSCTGYTKKDSSTVTLNFEVIP